MKALPILFSLICAAPITNAALVAGDLSIIGFRTDANDAISFVVWTAVTAGETVHFTDSGFFSDGTMRDSENIMSWTAPAGGLVGGSVIVISSPNGSSSANLGTTVGQLDGLSSGGDQVFAGTSAFPTSGDTSAPGSTYNGNLLFGINFAGSTWASTASSANTSALPSALASVGLNLAVAEIDNAQYTGPRTGLTVAEYKTEFLNTTNWTRNDDGATFGSLSATPFTIVPEPSTALLGGFGALALLRRRRS